MTSPRLARTIALTSAGAAAALCAAQEEALAIGVPVTVAVLDEGGAVKSISRMDGAPLISIETATSKAYAGGDRHAARRLLRGDQRRPGRGGELRYPTRTGFDRWRSAGRDRRHSSSRASASLAL